MNWIVLCSLSISVVAYCAIAYRIHLRTKVLGDQLPIGKGFEAKVLTASEFSASTVATTISLSTVVLAYYELAPYLGLFLLWSVVTTALGIAVMRMSAPTIWKRINVYKHRPTLHEFLGTEFRSPGVAIVGAMCTALGFLGAFAVELSVGSRFLASFLPDIPTWIVIGTLTTVAFAYTAAGGFRAVIVTDVIQMKAIWVMILALVAYYVWRASEIGVINFTRSIPPSIYNFSWREGLLAFLFGIFVINVPTFVSDMSIWQRISGSQDPGTVTKGMTRSIAGAAVTWGILAVVACLVPAIVLPKEGTNPLVALLNEMTTHGTVGAAFLFVVSGGLLAAMLSTASTQLIATTHTVYEDLVSHRRKHHVDERITSARELKVSRAILLGAAIIAVGVVEILGAVGFSIADLVFAVYGAQLGLFPAVALGLLRSREALQDLSRWAMASIALGFVAGWGSAGYGKMIGNGDLVFLAPVLSLVASSAVLGMGMMLTKRRVPD